MVCRSGRSDGVRDREHDGNRQDGGQLWKSEQDQGLTHHVAAAADGRDTVGADFRLEVQL